MSVTALKGLTGESVSLTLRRDQITMSGLKLYKEDQLAHMTLVRLKLYKYDSNYTKRTLK